jgi:hypothetical protein
MSSRYTSKTSISYSDFLKITGLLVVGIEAYKQCEAVEAALKEITGEDPNGFGHSGDAIYGGYSAKELLKKLDIKVEKPKEEE